MKIELTGTNLTFFLKKIVYDVYFYINKGDKASCLIVHSAGNTLSLQNDLSDRFSCALKQCSHIFYCVRKKFSER